MDAAIAAGADAVGLNFFPPSPRVVSMELAAALAARGPQILKVGVFVDPDDGLLDAAILAGRLGAVQLQGSETPARLADIRSRLGAGAALWKATGVRTAADVRAACQAFGTVDLLLLDARAPEGAALPGGNGLRFDWRVLAEARPAGDWGLAGGLTPETVGAAVRTTGAPLVDVASGVEDGPGVKNLAKIAAFVKAARHA